jgi:hypothetical protein
VSSTVFARVTSSLNAPVDEGLRSLFQLTLRKGPEFQRLHSAHQGVRQRAQAQQSRGASQEKLPAAAVSVDRGLDREHQLRGALDFVEREQALVTNKPGRVASRGSQCDAVIQRPVLSASPTPYQRLDERTLAHLSGAVDGDDARVSEARLGGRFEVTLQVA